MSDATGVSHLRITRLHAVNERFPGLACFGFAFWLAWQRIMWPMASQQSAGVISTSAFPFPLMLHLLTNGAFIICIVVCALMARRFEYILTDVRTLIGGVICATLGSIMVCVALNTSSIATPIFIAGSVLAGIGMGLLLIRCMVIYGMLDPQRILLMTALAWCGGAVMSVVFTQLPPLGLCVIFCLLSFISAFFFTLKPMVQRESKVQIARYSVHPWPPRSFWNFALTVLFISLAGQSLVYFNGGGFDSANFDSSDYVDLVVMGVASLLMLYAVFFPSSYNFSTLYYPIILIVIALLALLFISPEPGTLALTITRATFQIFGLILWCILAFITRQSKASPIAIFGFGYGLHMLGSVVGYIIGYQIGPFIGSQSIDPLFLYPIIAILVLAISIAVYPPRTMRDLFATLPDDDIEPTSNYQLDMEWDQACDAVALAGNLTAREREVMLLLAKGRGSAYIADKLSISLSTTYTHTRNIYKKLNVHSREELMALIDHSVEVTKNTHEE